jgi:hypothetical protein
MTVRFAKEDDIPFIQEILKDPEFFIYNSQLESTPIGVYTELELKTWTGPDNSHDVTLISECYEGKVGFLYCKIMAKDWACIECFYVLPKYRYRKPNFADELLVGIENCVRGRGINFLSTYISPDNVSARNMAKHRGFKESRSYIWYGKELP